MYLVGHQMVLWFISIKLKSSTSSRNSRFIKLSLTIPKTTKNSGSQIKFTMKSISFVQNIHYKRFTSISLINWMKSWWNPWIKTCKFGRLESKFYQSESPNPTFPKESERTSKPWKDSKSTTSFQLKRKKLELKKKSLSKKDKSSRWNQTLTSSKLIWLRKFNLKKMSSKWLKLRVRWFSKKKRQRSKQNSSQPFRKQQCIQHSSHQNTWTTWHMTL